jgi:hypothetical protein
MARPIRDLRGQGKRAEERDRERKGGREDKIRL